MKSTTLFGIDTLIKHPEKLNNLRIGLACNAASMTSDGIHSRIALLKAGFNIIKYFAPEHGFQSVGDDGAYISNSTDKETNIPIISLYGDKLAPSKEDLADLDLVIIDLPDIGTRFYTYLWTMTHILESCERNHKKVLLLDRPNPIAQDIAYAEGPLLDSKCASFIGRFNIPITHHTTFGELAQYFKHNFYPKLSLEIIKMKNWDRVHNDGYPFFPTSPAIQKRDTTYTYPGSCLFEGLNINEGRGTEYPFSQFGAPWIDAKVLLKNLEEKKYNVDFEIVKYKPAFGLYTNELCHGLKVSPKDKKRFQSVQFYIELIQLIYTLHPNELEERKYPTNANPNGTKHLDKLIGVPNSFEFLKNNKVNTSAKITYWINEISPFLLY